MRRGRVCGFGVAWVVAAVFLVGGCSRGSDPQVPPGQAHMADIVQKAEPLTPQEVEQAKQMCQEMGAGWVAVVVERDGVPIGVRCDPPQGMAPSPR